jgi:hypothetical protein
MGTFEGAAIYRASTGPRERQHDELQAVSMEADLHGQVLDYAAKGAYVGLEGIEKVEGH